jgi:hypothetical protein
VGDCPNFRSTKMGLSPSEIFVCGLVAVNPTLGRGKSGGGEGILRACVAANHAFHRQQGRWGRGRSVCFHDASCICGAPIAINRGGHAAADAERRSKRVPTQSVGTRAFVAPIHHNILTYSSTVTSIYWAGFFRGYFNKLAFVAQLWPRVF